MLRALTRPTYGWKRHPAVRMRAGYTEGIAAYGMATCLEWISRGRRHGGGHDRRRPRRGRTPVRPPHQHELARVRGLPEWIGDERVHASHRAALVRKDPVFYGTLFPDADPELPYCWPVG